MEEFNNKLVCVESDEDREGECDDLQMHNVAQLRRCAGARELYQQEKIQLYRQLVKSVSAIADTLGVKRLAEAEAKLREKFVKLGMSGFGTGFKDL